MEAFQFLRPPWLLSLIPLPVVLWWLWRQTRPGQAWEQACDPHLLPHLLVQLGYKQQRLPLALLGLGWLLTSLALAGPAWEKLPQPTFKSQLARVLVLDLSHSMNAADLKPSRLTLAKYKTQDILKRSEEHQTALLVFAGDVHVVSPLTSDADTIAAMVSSLNTEIMPVAGSRPDLALTKAVALLEQNGSQRGEIILLTDGLERRDATLAAARNLSEQGYRLSVLAVGTPEGAPIPMQDGGYLKDASGGIVMPRLTPGPLQELAAVGGGSYSPLTSSPRDLDRLLLPASTFDMDNAQEDENQLTEAWREEGPWLLLGLLPLAALGFRRGWVMGITLTATLTLMLTPPPAFAWEWQDLWQRRDQQGAQAMAAQQPAEAAELFDSSDWQGTAHYRAGDYEQAATAFAQSDTAQGHYNRGNALAKGGKLEQAIAAYETTLEKAPEHQQAKENLELVKKLLEEQQQQQQNQQDDNEQSEQQEQQDSSQDKQKDSQNRDGEQQGDSNQGQQEEAESAEEQRNQQSEQQQAQQDEQQNEQQEQQEAQQQADSESQESEEEASAQANANPMMTEEAQQQQLLEQYLNRIEDDPSGLLREKFRRQTLRQRGKVTPEDGQAW